MSDGFEGLTEFQKDLLEMAQVKLPKETFKIMRKIGNKATTAVRKEARAKVKNVTTMYYKRFKRGKVFKDAEGKIVTRVINSSPHAHLIEHGHRQVVNPGKGKGNGRGVIPGKGIGREIGFVHGKNVVSNGIKNFNESGEFEKMLSTWLDEELDKGNL